MNLYLIGYRGSGKSTVAPILADLLSMKFVDTDEMIESKAKTSISQIFAEHGEPHFRALETEAIVSLQENANLIVSLGGGAPLAKTNREWLSKTGKTVWLTAAPAVLWKRISGDHLTADRRPSLTDKDGLAEVEEVLQQRTPVYEGCADYSIDVQTLSPEQIANKIADWWKLADRE